jgi:hypothetical protein
MLTHIDMHTIDVCRDISDMTALVYTGTTAIFPSSPALTSMIRL